MSPEQVQFVRNDPRSDLFALGVMLYHFTTGERPFGSPDSVRGLRRRLYTDPIPPRTLRENCPPWLQEVILKCLEVEPARRWQSAAQLALALQNPLQVPLTARADHHALGRGLEDLLGRRATRLRAGRVQRVAPARGLDERRRPVPAAEGRVGPFEEEHLRPRHVRVHEVDCSSSARAARPSRAPRPLRVRPPRLRAAGHRRRRTRSSDRGSRPRASW